MATKVVIEIVGMPMAMPRPRRAKFGGVYMPSWFTQWKQAAQMQCQAAMEGRPPLEGACKLSVLCVFPVPSSWSGKKVRLALQGLIPHITKPDVDHTIQSAMDSCT